MVNRIIIIILFFFAFNIYSFAKKDSIITPNVTTAELWSQFDDIFNDPNFSNAHWGVVVQSLETGEYLYKRNSNKLFVPASNLKLFTTSSALTLLNSDYKIKTEIYAKGEIKADVLNGDLIIKGYGDPTISGRFSKGDIFNTLNSWADSLLRIGVEEISGNIIADDNSFDDVGLGNGWSWDYESYWYAAPSGALAFNDNCIDVQVYVEKNSQTPIVKTNPNTKYAVIINDVEIVSSDSTTTIDVFRERGTNIIKVVGTIKDNDTVKTYVTVNNPSQYFAVVFKEVLESKGIKVNGSPIDVDDISTPLDYTSFRLLFTNYSLPLKEIVKVINKVSQNFYAEQLLKIIGYEKKGLGSAENGIEACKEAYREMGINPESILIEDGSGLSRLNMVTPQSVVSLLTFMYKSKNNEAFLNSLPISGIDGTISGRMKGTKAEGKIKAKTGFVGSVRSLSGYAFTADNEPVVFSIIANNFNVPVKLADNIQDLVCLRLANFSRNNRR